MNRGSTVRAPAVHIPTLSPVIGKAVFSVHRDPHVDTPTPARSESRARTRSPVPVSQRKPWGANASTPRKHVVPTPKTEPRRSSFSYSPPSTASKQGSNPKPQQARDEPPVDRSKPLPVSSNENIASEGILRRLENAEKENQLLRSLVLELASQMSELRRELRDSRDVQDARITEISTKTNYVAGWVDHFNGLVARAESNESPQTDIMSSDDQDCVVRALDMASESP